MLIFQLVKYNYYASIILHHTIIPYFLAIITLLIRTVMANIITITLSNIHFNICNIQIPKMIWTLI